MDNKVEKLDGNENLGEGAADRPETAADARSLNLGAGGGDAARPAEVEELRRQLQSSRVEAGRVKALSQQLRDRDEEIARLKAQLEEARASQPHDYMSDIPEAERDQVDPVTVNAIGRAMDRRLREAEESRMRMEAERDAQTRQMRDQEFLGRVDREFPGFLAATNAGGDKKEPWERFLRTYGPSVRFAVDRHDFDSLSNLINQFYREIGVPTQRTGADAAATPRPLPTDTGAERGGEGRVYTYAEYQTILEKAGTDYRGGIIDRPKYRAICAELERAANEGRVAMG